MQRAAIEIRQIGENDIDGFHETFSLVARERRYLSFLEPPPIDQTRAFIRQNIADDVPQLVAVSDGNILGWCDVTPLGCDVARHVGVLGMAVHPCRRGQGLGTRLLQATLDAAWAYGFLRVELGVFSHNARAYALYKKFGFVEEGVSRRRILIDGEFSDEVRMAIVARG